MKAYSIRIYGRVFNVGFRRYVHRYAMQCNIKGYVENDHDDGSVHIEAEGTEEDLELPSTPQPCEIVSQAPQRTQEKAVETRQRLGHAQALNFVGLVACSVLNPTLNSKVNLSWIFVLRSIMA